METNYYANVYLTKYALPCLRGHGQILAIASLTGKLGSPQRSIYCASKFALVGYL
jgi:short-subunit dehydrogenase